MKFFDIILAEGNRKALMSLLAIIITVLTEKYTGPLSQSALDALVYIVGIFVGGNAAEHFANALKIKYSGPVPTVAPTLAQVQQQQANGPTVEQLATYAQKIAKDSTERFAAIEQILTKQGNSINGLVNAINNNKNVPQSGQEY